MKIAVIGAGNMGGAIAEGAVRKNVIRDVDLTVSDPRPDFAERLTADGFNIFYTTDNASAVREADLVIVAVKPWLMEEVLGGIAGVLDRQRQTIASIASGITFAQLAGFLKSDVYGGIGLYRIIPNTAISLGRSVTFVSKHNTTERSDRQVMELFEALGDVFTVEEGKMAARTALASSGIAYALKYMDAAMRGGETMGLGREEALRIVVKTVEGAAALLESGWNMPQAEIDRVTTPGGITLKGLEEMERCGFSQAVINGLLATK